MKRFFYFTLCSLALMLVACSTGKETDYSFDGTMSQQVLENYLEHSATVQGFLTDKDATGFNVDFDFIKNTGAKFVGRAALKWGGEQTLDGEEYWDRIKTRAAKAHDYDPDIILQAAVFEIVTKAGVNQVTIPAWVFEAYGMPVERRCFDYDKMLFPDGYGVDKWNKDESVPDIRQPETQMWFYYLIRRYVEAGCEAIHLGQTMLMGHYDQDGWPCYSSLLKKVREECGKSARRHFVLFDSHAYGDQMVVDGYSLLDYNAFPIRMKPDSTQHLACTLEVGYVDAIFGKTIAVTTPSGWKCEHLPYLVEIDNYGISDHPGEYGKGFEIDCFIWGYDEISWFYALPAERRKAWLQYAYDWLKKTDPVGHLEMPCTRWVNTPDTAVIVHGCAPSDSVPYAFDVEQTIKDLWNKK